jgi:hypothetical protein
VFQVVTTLALIRISYDAHQEFFSLLMRLSWPQHLQTARMLERADDTQRGMALALMGVSLLILVEDLLESERPSSGEKPIC